MTEMSAIVQNFNPLFTEFERSNPLEESRNKALAYQAILRAWSAEASHDEMQELIEQAIGELDADLTSLNKTIVVTGSVSIKTVDIRGVMKGDDVGSDGGAGEYLIDPSAIDSRPHFFEDEALQSLGYVVDRYDDQLVVAHLARPYTTTPVVTSVKFGDILRSERIYIPIDGTALIEPEKDPNIVDISSLEYHLADLIADIDLALLNSEDLSDALQKLGMIDLEAHPLLNQNREISLEVSKYINACLEVQETAVFSITGASCIRVQGKDGEFITGEIDPSLVMTGHIIGTGVDYSTNRFTVVTSMPFDDNTQRSVLYGLSDSFSVTEHAAFSL